MDGKRGVGPSLGTYHHLPHARLGAWQVRHALGLSQGATELIKKMFSEHEARRYSVESQRPWLPFTQARFTVPDTTRRELLPAEHSWSRLRSFVS